jgi:hypothetical protein
LGLVADTSTDRLALFHRLRLLFEEIDRAVKRGDPGAASACLAEVDLLTRRTTPPPPRRALRGK